MQQKVGGGSISQIRMRNIVNQRERERNREIEEREGRREKESKDRDI